MFWLSSNNRWVGSIDWSFVGLMSTNFNRRTSHETSCCKIRSSLALRVHWGCGSFSWKTGWQRLRNSPDLAPCDIFLFPKMKRDLKGKRFQNVEEVREKTTETLKAINLQEFQNCFEQRKKRWDNCIDSQGEYFEGDQILEMFREIYDLKKNSRYFWVPPRIMVFRFCDHNTISTKCVLVFGTIWISCRITHALLSALQVAFQLSNQFPSNILHRECWIH